MMQILRVLSARCWCACCGLRGSYTGVAFMQRSICKITRCLQQADISLLHRAACQILHQCAAHDLMPPHTCPSGLFLMAWPACASAPSRTWWMAWCSWAWMPSAPWARAAPQWRSTPRACPLARWGQQAWWHCMPCMSMWLTAVAAARSHTASSLAVGEGTSVSVAGRSRRCSDVHAVQGPRCDGLVWLPGLDMQQRG